MGLRVVPTALPPQTLIARASEAGVSRPVSAGWRGTFRGRRVGEAVRAAVWGEFRC